MICAYDECKKEFTPKTHNQKYCSDECCRTATNLKIKEKYHDKKARLSGKKRLCKKCKAELSRYQDDNICTLCKLEPVKKEKEHLRNLIKNVIS